MDGLTKTHLDKDVLQILIRNAFGSSADLRNHTELKEGFFNTAYMITLNDGREVVIKISPPPEVRVLRYEKNIMNTEVQVLRLLKKAGIIPVPEVYYYDNTCRTISNEYFFMEKLGGEPYNKVKETLSRQERETIETELGGYTRSINEIRGIDFGYFSQPDKRSTSWSKAFEQMLKDVLEDGRDYDVRLPAAYDYIDNLVSKHLPLLDSITEPRLVHWDLWDGNVFVGGYNGTKKITGIIDCERALWGDPLIEFNFGSLAGDNLHFKRGYGREMIPAPADKFRRILYDIYLYLIMTIECSYRCYENDWQEKWAYGKLEEEINILKDISCK